MNATEVTHDRVKESVSNDGDIRFNEGVNGYEKEIENYRKEKLSKLSFRVITKHAIISFAAVLISFFMDIARVPLLGDISINIAKGLFPNWNPAAQSFSPISFWWIPILAYGVFLLFAYKTYFELRLELRESTSSDIIDRIIGASISVIDGISTALPLIGAAILLISIKLGPEVFIGLSVPFEIKALMVLAIGKLFEPVLDELGVQFQHIVNGANEIKSKRISQLQTEHLQKVIRQIDNSSHINALAAVTEIISVDDLKYYEEVFKRTAELSRQIQQSFQSTFQILDKINSLQNLSSEKMAEMRSLAAAIASASEALKDERTIKALSSLEAIVKK
ncbi:MAG: hypothetical protein ACM3Q2_00435 [Syntrophothermus sp.]